MRAIVRKVGDSFVNALAERPQRIHLAKARRQHDRYVLALRGLCDLVVEIQADEAHPDCPFVEDQAVVADGRAVITRAGHPARRGEAAAVQQALEGLGVRCVRMQAPATADGGDVLRIGGTLFVGRSRRTNGEGIGVLARSLGLAVQPVPIGGLHLKSVCSSPADRLVLVAADTVDPALFTGCDVLVVPPHEAHAANAVGVGQTVVIPAGCPATRAALQARGLTVVEVGTSEFRKADGALTCLSILI